MMQVLQIDKKTVRLLDDLDVTMPIISIVSKTIHILSCIDLKVPLWAFIRLGWPTASLVALGSSPKEVISSAIEQGKVYVFETEDKFLHWLCIRLKENGYG